ncbi:hypothetical protein EVJ58_g2501 [Rhodofomes roseus]|uniref:Uncharacterized protein n=1 Tax=Rhodofomes roseus TaxID=34475 RepID=A0A4Y9YS63_9APHY|nr:hypothetical protein EVJ58_g2501 [Rhodofomes roseus]
MCGVTFTMVSSSPKVGKKMNCYNAALNATRAAVEEDLLPGDDVAPLKACLAQRALLYLARMIFANADEENSVLVSTMMQQYGEEDKFAWSYDNRKKGTHIFSSPPHRAHPLANGVTVAKSIQLKDKFENLGVCLVQDFASKMNKNAGDSTTTATVLARAIYAEGRRRARRRVPLFARKDHLHHRRDYPSRYHRRNGDAHVGILIAQAMENVGKEGVITVKEGRTIDDEIEFTEGMRVDRGFISPY